MATKFAEAVLGIHFRQVVSGAILSGPMYYLRDGLRSAPLAATYALVAGVAALTTTPFTQPNSIAVAVNAVFGVPTWIVGVVVAVLTWMVIIGGISSIGRAAEKLAPLKVGLYLAGGAVVIVTFADQLPAVLATVVHEAWTTRSALGLGVFVAMRYGIARSIYANEAGFGTAAVAYGTARSSRPTDQGLQAVVEVFIVSFVTATISALTILLSGVAGQAIAARQRGDEFLTSTAAVAGAFDAAMPTVGGWVVALCAFLFGYTTLIGWSYYGEQFLEYLLGARVRLPYRWIYCLLIPFGAMLRPEVVWAWGDLMNALQIFPNLVGLVALSGIAATYARRTT
jgi:AGCS family alanine or glycine:cation symporter